MLYYGNSGKRKEITMKKQEYETLILRIVFYTEQDVITASQGQDPDDVGGWNSDWFAKGNG